MAEPKTFDEYLTRFAASQRFEGFGADTTTVAPCPILRRSGFPAMEDRNHRRRHAETRHLSGMRPHRQGGHQA